MSIVNNSINNTTNSLKVNDVTNHGIVIGRGTTAALTSSVLTSGQILIGSTSNDPAAATLTAGTGIEVANASGSITISSTTILINTQTDSYQLIATDAGKLIQMNKASANTLTVPLNSTVGFAIGTQILVEQVGAGTTSIGYEVGVTINSSGGALDIYGQYSAAILIKTATNTWMLAGDLA